MRIVSLVPNGTEILFALGLDEEIVGVSHECDHPPAARTRPQLTGSALAADLTPSEIDSAVSAQIGGGGSLYTLDESRIESLEPDLIVTQELCPVCAVSTEQVDAAVAPLARCPDVLALDPSTMAEVFEDIRTVARRTGRIAQGDRLIGRLEARLRAVASRVADRPRPRVVALEWLDPFFCAGHWVPEMIAAAGAEDVLGRAGADSQRIDLERIREADPDWIVAMPCGFDDVGAAAQTEAISLREGWRDLRAVRANRVAAVDANGLFSRPGPRLVDGVEVLADLFHPPAPEGERHNIREGV